MKPLFFRSAFSSPDVQLTRVIGTQMTQIQWICADCFELIDVIPHSQPHFSNKPTSVAEDVSPVSLTSLPHFFVLGINRLCRPCGTLIALHSSDPTVKTARDFLPLKQTSKPETSNLKPQTSNLKPQTTIFPFVTVFDTFVKKFARPFLQFRRL